MQKSSLECASVKGIRGKRVVVATAVMAALVLLGTGLLCRDRLREEYWLRKLGGQPVEGKFLAAIRLGEMRSVRAVPALIREFPTIVGKAETAPLRNHAYQVFQEALVQIGTASLPRLVRSLAPMDFERSDVCMLIQDALQILYLNIPHREPAYAESVFYDVEALRRALRTMRDDPRAALEVREAAAYALEKNSTLKGSE